MVALGRTATEILAGHHTGVDYSADKVVDLVGYGSPRSRRRTQVGLDHGNLSYETASAPIDTDHNANDFT